MSLEELDELENALRAIEKRFKIDKIIVSYGNDNQGEYVEIEVIALGGVYTQRVYANAFEKWD